MNILEQQISQLIKAGCITPPEIARTGVEGVCWASEHNGRGYVLAVQATIFRGAIELLLRNGSFEIPRDVDWKVLGRGVPKSILYLEENARHTGATRDAVTVVTNAFPGVRTRTMKTKSIYAMFDAK